jgi:ComF family protein
MAQPAASTNGQPGATPEAKPPATPPWRQFARRALDAVLPPQCLRCHAIIDAPGALCADCWDGVTFLAPPLCDTCGLPFEYDAGPGTLCGECVRQAPPFERARAAMVYDVASRDLLLAFKHGDRTEAARAFGAWMGRAGAGLLATADVVTAVPLHWTRLFARRYNQAALLAQAIGRGAGVPVVPDLLLRRRKTPSQGGLGPAQRRRNLQGALAPNRRRAAWIDGRRVLLVDDVMTTGATASASARTLLRAGAAAVDVLTLARVVRTD